jgi:hypothetical protein
LFKLSSQGRRNDLIAPTDPNDATTTLIKSADVLSMVHDGQSSISMKDIVCALEECEKLKKTSVTRSDGKRIFGDYGKSVMYTCVGVQVSRNSADVLNVNAVMEKLPECHWHLLMKLMRHAEYCFEAIADNEVVSHLYHAKQVVPFKT